MNINKIEQFIAKDTGEKLYDHSLKVSIFAVEIAKQTIIDKNSDLIEQVRIAALLHDIGKITKSFQDMLSGKKKTDKNKFRHNEIGWAFLSKYLKTTHERLGNILDCVYWHHGISNKLNNNFDSEILDSITDEDINNMLEYLKYTLGEDGIRIPDERKKRKTPLYFDSENENENVERNFIKTCVLSADRLFASYENIDGDFVKNIINKEILKSNDFEIINNGQYDNDRFNVQNKISQEEFKTLKINAPAGNGKTIIGLMINSKSKNKLLWICPRNMVATSVYNSVLEELETFNINNISVELYLGGEVKKRNNTTKTKDFDSDIIITNIDNFLNPSIENKNMDRLYFINNCDVIFDEYHELINESAIFSCFVNIMRIRHGITTSKTTLLSATPLDIEYLWDTANVSTKILPGKNLHFDASHNKKYNINILEYDSVQELYIEKGENNLVIYNSIANSQIGFKHTNSDLLIHSGFEDSQRKSQLDVLYEQYGKQSKRRLKKIDVIGTHVVQASLDISFNNLFESILSPQSTVQRIGRCNRWGDYENISSINIVKFNDKSENKMKDILYTRNLSDLWFDFLKPLNGQQITLDELYKIYNSFNEAFSVQVRKFIDKSYFDSLKSLEKIYPIKFNEKKTKTDVKTAGGNKLRATNNLELFYICKKYNSSDYTEPISRKIYKSIQEDFSEEGNIQNKLISTMKEIRNVCDDRYQYNDIIDNKHVTLDEIRTLSRKSNTPYIRFDVVYHPELGVINKSLLNSLVNK